MSTISYFSSAKSTSGKPTDLDFFLTDIKNGRWQNAIIDYKTGLRAKESLPAVTLSGEFTKRKASELIRHSRYICIDIDALDDLDYTIDILKQDPYVYALWKSVSGFGLAVLFNIDPRYHLKAFLGLSEYLFNSYELIVDQSCKDVSRLRFVSYDPELYINPSSVKFTKYPVQKKKTPAKLPKTVFVKNDFVQLITQLEGRNIDIVNEYQDWLNVGLGIADKFGEDGRDYFHRISAVGTKYDQRTADKQYTACVRANGSGITIATFYWLCKRAGLETMSPQTKLIAVTASNARKGGRDAKSTVKLLTEIENIPEDESEDIVKQIFENNIEIPPENFLFQLETYIRQNYDIKRNSITKRLEINGEPMEDEDFNTIFIDARKMFDNQVSFEIVSRLINSDFTHSYNPLIEWIEKNKKKVSTGNIDKLARTIITDMDYHFIDLFLKKWLIGIIESIHGDPSPLMLVLSGERQNTGKTEWFRRLLPPDLKSFYAESQLDRGKDDEILMTQKLIIMNDEMGGKTREDIVRLKNLSSKDMFTLRKPYGKSNIDLKRLAVLAGTSNDDQLLNDPTGNRRIIPFSVKDIDKDLYNSIDKTELFVEVYWLYEQSSFTSTLSNDQIEYLNNHTKNFDDVSIEAELIEKWYQPDGPIFVTNTDIKVFLESVSKQRLSSRKIGMELKRLGYDKISKRQNNYKISKGYMVYELNRYTPNQIVIEDDKPPF